MARKLFLLDGMALVYRAHFALIKRPVFNAKGVNTSALFGFTQTLLEIINKQEPTHLGVAFDTGPSTRRKAEFPEYKAQRQVMPEDITAALPQVRRMLEAFNIPIIIGEGSEADDLIGTLVRRAEREGFQSYMVTPDKDFAQLVSESTFFYKPSRLEDAVEIFGLPEIQSRWGVQRPEQVIDILALWGDASDNIPGVPGIGEKTAMKLIGQYGSVENLLAHTSEVSGKLKENLEANREQALLSKRLATIDCDVPCPVELESLKVRPPDEARLKAILIEFEFNTIGRRLFGADFSASPGLQPSPASSERKSAAPTTGKTTRTEELVLTEGTKEPVSEQLTLPVATELKTIADVPHEYKLLTTPEERAGLVRALESLPSFCFRVQATSPDAKEAQLLGLAFSFQPRAASYVSFNQTETILEEFRSVLESERIEKGGHDLKVDLAILKQHGISVRGKLFDTLIAHCLIEPDLRHAFDYLLAAFLEYRPVPISKLIGEKTTGPNALADVPAAALAEYAGERVDFALQLRAKFDPLLKEKGQERVFHEIETPLIPVLVDMEYEGVKIDAAALAEFSTQLSKEIADHEKTIYRMADTEFNLNSAKQLGQILFDVLKIGDGPKKTKTGQYATDERTLTALAAEHEIVRRLLEYRVATKIKSTYADALPTAIWPKTGRVHTTYNQMMTSTGRLNSQDPNLQNIPIRRERGQEIRKAFVPRSEDYLLLSADYSQIELRIIAALSGEEGLLEALRAGLDVHTATAAKVFGVALDAVTAEMRRTAKMVNYGIAYGISAFGLAQRLDVPRADAANIIEQYFKQFPCIRKYMNDTIAFARDRGYVETVTGRRRYLRDIRSANKTVRSAAERNAINAPIQGTAADMIKLAMINIHRELTGRKLKTRMLLQVHDELVFDLYKAEQNVVLPLVEEKMKTAIPLEVPIVVEMGLGRNWLEAH